MSLRERMSGKAWPLSINIFTNSQVSGYSIAVEHMPSSKEVIGSNPALCWPFFLSLSFYHSVVHPLTGSIEELITNRFLLTIGL